MIKFRRIGSESSTYATVADLKASDKEWRSDNENDCELFVEEDDRVFMFQYMHFGFDDGDTSAVVIKDELTPKEIADIRKLYKLKSPS